MNTPNFTDKHSFSEFLLCQDLYNYLYTLSENVENFKILDLTENFEEYVRLNGQKALNDFILERLQYMSFMLNSAIENSNDDNIIEYDSGAFGNDYVSDYTENTPELYNKLDFINKLLMLNVWYED